MELIGREVLSNASETRQETDARYLRNCVSEVDPAILGLGDVASKLKEAGGSRRVEGQAPRS